MTFSGSNPEVGDTALPRSSLLEPKVHRRFGLRILGLYNGDGGSVRLHSYRLGKGETTASTYEDELDASPSSTPIGRPITERAHVRGALAELKVKETEGLHSPNSEQLDSLVRRIGG